MREVPGDVVGCIDASGAVTLSGMVHRNQCGGVLVNSGALETPGGARTACAPRTALGPSRFPGASDTTIPRAGSGSFPLRARMPQERRTRRVSRTELSLVLMSAPFRRSIGCVQCKCAAGSRFVRSILSAYTLPSKLRPYAAVSACTVRSVCGEVSLRLKYFNEREICSLFIFSSPLRGCERDL